MPTDLKDHMMIRRFCFALLLVFAVGAATAQEIPDSPLLAYFNGVFYEYDDSENALVELTACQPDERLMGSMLVAPHGQGYIFTTFPQIIRDALQALGSLGGTPLPMNIWYCDLEARTLTRIYASPGADDEFVGDVPELRAVQSLPVWSPDGTQIAWVTRTFPEDTLTITTYATADGTTTEYPVELPITLDSTFPPQPYWADGVFFFIGTTLSDETFVIEDYIYTYDFTEQRIATEAQLTSGGGEFDDFVVEAFVATDSSGQAVFAQRFFDAGWVSTDIRTAESTPAPGLPVLVSPFAPEGVQLALDIDESYFYNWQAVALRDANDNPVAYPATPLQRITLSPAGDAIAFADSRLRIRRGTEVVEVANSQGLADDARAHVRWAHPAWRFSEVAELGPPPLPTCEGALASRIRPPAQATVVSPTVPNNVRDNPSLSANRIGQLAGGATFDVLDGPVCSDGFAWYQVQSGNLIGWTAEGSAAEYFIAPAE